MSMVDSLLALQGEPFIPFSLLVAKCQKMPKCQNFGKSLEIWPFLFAEGHYLMVEMEVE